MVKDVLNTFETRSSLYFSCSNC